MPATLRETTTLNAPGYRWDRLGSRPRKGWDLFSVDDLGEPEHECEACGYPEVRYVHTLRHPDDPESLRVGCVCCEHLIEDYLTPRAVERHLRNRQRRLARLLDLDKWRRTRAGNFRIRYGKAQLVLYPLRFGAGWRINVGDVLGRHDHPTNRQAIRAAFRHIDPLRAYAPSGP